jgi:hypothetical protein
VEPADRHPRPAPTARAALAMSVLGSLLACANLVASLGGEGGWRLVSLAMAVLGMVVGGYWWQRLWSLRTPSVPG